MVREMIEIIESMKMSMKSTPTKTKHYVDKKKKKIQEFEVGDIVLLKVTLHIFWLKLGKSKKLSPRFGAFLYC